MKTKQAIAGFLAAAVITGALPCLSASAADNVAISVGKATAAPGASFSVDVSLGSIPATGLCAVEFAVEFDTSLVTINDVTTGALCDTGAAAAEATIDASLKDTTFDWNVADNQLCVTWVTGLTDSAYWLKDGGVFITISGTVKSTATAGTTTDFTVVPIARDTYPDAGTVNSDILVGYVDNSGAATNYASTATKGTLTISGGASGKTIYGDVDCNGTVAIADVVLLARYVAQDKAASVTAQGITNADCSYDEKLDATDISYIARYLAGTLTASEMGPQ